MPDLGSLLVVQPNGSLGLVGPGLLRALLRRALPIGLALLLTGILLVFRSPLLGALLRLVALAPTLLLLLVVLSLGGRSCVGLAIVLLLALLPALLAIHLAVTIRLRILLSLRLPVGFLTLATLSSLWMLRLCFSTLLLTAGVGSSLAA